MHDHATCLLSLNDETKEDVDKIWLRKGKKMRENVPDSKLWSKFNYDVRFENYEKKRFAHIAVT